MNEHQVRPVRVAQQLSRVAIAAVALGVLLSMMKVYRIGSWTSINDALPVGQGESLA